MYDAHNRRLTQPLSKGKIAYTACFQPAVADRGICDVVGLGPITPGVQPIMGGCESGWQPGVLGSQLSKRLVPFCLVPS
jgi:hypothetical protein